MMYLIQEEITSFVGGTRVRTEIKGYYECDDEEIVKEFCKNKTKEIEDTYDKSKMDKIYSYKKISKLS